MLIRNKPKLSIIIPITSVVLAVMLLLFFILINRHIDNNSYITFRDAQSGTVLKYPHDWVKNPRGVGNTPGSNIVIVDSRSTNSTSGYVSEFSVGSEDVPQGFTLDGYLKEFIKLLSHWGNNFQLVHADTKSTLAGFPAYRFMFKLTTPNGRNEYYIVSGARVGSKVYSIVSQTDVDQYFHYMPTISNMISSFQIVGSTDK
jgi:PsbP